MNRARRSAVCIRWVSLCALIFSLYACSDGATPSDSGKDTEAVADTSPNDSGVAEKPDGGDKTDAGGADSKDASPEDAGLKDTSNAECAVAGDCNKKGAPGACRGWTCDAGTCLKKTHDDGIACDGADKCHPGVCANGACNTKAMACADNKKPCKPLVCDNATGKCEEVAVADGEVCEDNNTCTDGDTCAAGKCAAGTNKCECVTKADCTTKDDDDLCNGMLYCATSTHTCEVEPSTVVKCGDSENTACQKKACAPKTGKCALQDVADGAECEDGKPCTKGDVCKAGKCDAGTDTCGCNADKDCAKEEDGDACNGTLFATKPRFRGVVGSTRRRRKRAPRPASLAARTPASPPPERAR